MATWVEVQCIKRTGSNYINQAIAGIGGYHNGSRWYMPEQQVIDAIRNNQLWFYVSRGGQSVDVVIAKLGDKEYLKTRPDDITQNNLLSLPECP